MQSHLNIKALILTAAVCFITISWGCKKLVSIPEPINSITTDETFATTEKATSAVSGIYYDMSVGNNTINYACGSITFYAGVYADELIASGSLFENLLYYQFSQVQSNGGELDGQFWGPAYSDIYKANATIEGLEASTKLTSAVKNQLIGECKFLRAFCYFYLVNLFGDVPLVTTSSWQSNSLLKRADTSQVYQQIISDLKDAQNLLAGDYAISVGERIRANKWAATALLARVYLYNADWEDAETQATAVINNSSLYNLTPLSDIFLRNSSEAILQWQCVNQSQWNYATYEGYVFNLPNSNFAKSKAFAPSDQLLADFEVNDQRRTTWIDSSVIRRSIYRYPCKYKIYSTTEGNNPEYYTVLRLAEQYLIRAEAEAKQSRLAEAIADLDVVRTRAGLDSLPTSLDQGQVLAAAAHENRIEFLAEWGHRWFDLKRTGQADAVLGPIKGSSWKTTNRLWPLPQSEIITDPNLTQNPGY